MTTFYLKYQQLVLAFLYLLLAVAIYWQNQLGPAIIFGSLGLFLFVQFFRGGPLHMAVCYAKKGNLNAARKIVSSIRDPERLPARKRSYYFFASAILRHEEGELSAAMEFYKEAFFEGLLHHDDDAYANLQLSRIFFAQGKDKEAMDSLKLASRLARHKRIQSEIEDFERSIALSSTERVPVSLFF